jgi:hypothetical protein
MNADQTPPDRNPDEMTLDELRAAVIDAFGDAYEAEILDRQRVARGQTPRHEAAQLLQRARALQTAHRDRLAREW